LTEKEKIAWQTRRWKNRREWHGVLYYALLAIILLFFFAPIPESRLAIIAEPISMMAFVFRWCYWCIYGIYYNRKI
jgi:hypothetical protein